MAHEKLSGTPVTGFVSLTNGAPGPTALTLQSVQSGSTVTLAASEVVVITAISISSNDTATPLVTIDDGATAGAYTARILGKFYTSSALPALALSYPPGTLVCRRGVNPRATAGAVTSTKTVEVVIDGYITINT